MKRSGMFALAAAVGMFAGAAPAQNAQQQSAGASDRDKTLKVGDKAPELQVAEWVKGEPIEHLNTGNIYVVEFWATWCPPCRDSIPHLTKLQEKYEDDDVHVIGVSSERGGLEDIEPFVEDIGDRMDYRVAYDDSRQTSAAYMEAAGQNSIPTAFIVDRDKRVAWIGHPMSMDDVLDEVVKGEYDMESAQEAAEREAELMRKAQPMLDKLEKAVQAGEISKATDIAAEIAALDYEMFFNVALWRYQQLMTRGETEKANGYLTDLVNTHVANAVQPLNAIAWTIATGQQEEGRDLDLALKAAKRAHTLAKHEDPDVVDTLARVHFERGDTERAIKHQEQAVEMAEGQAKQQFKKTLDEVYKTALEDE